MNKTLDEGNLHFNFLDFNTVERFDDDKINPHGMKSVDFIAEKNDFLYFIEVKDFQNPNATEECRNSDYEMLMNVDNEKKAVFPIEMGVKIKDSLLRKYFLGYKFTKKVIYLLFVNLDKFGEEERGRLKIRIMGHIPIRLDRSRFNNFTSISFDLVNAEQLKVHGIICTSKQ